VRESGNHEMAKLDIKELKAAYDSGNKSRATKHKKEKP